MIRTTLVYLQDQGYWLMLRRDKKKQDINAGKWIGTGGKLEEGETPRACAYRETVEETGLKPASLTYRGTVYFCYGDIDSEKMYVYTGTVNDRAFSDSDEGTLAWIREEDILTLPLWEGDKAFLPLLMKPADIFCMSLLYDQHGNLLKVETLPAETENQ